MNEKNLESRDMIGEEGIRTIRDLPVGYNADYISKEDYQEFLSGEDEKTINNIVNGRIGGYKI